MKKRLILLFALICLTALLLPLTVSATTPQDGWYDWGDGSHSYFRNGEIVTDEVIQIDGAYYGFNWNGIMYADEDFWLDCYYYRAKDDGVLYCNEWVQPYADEENYTWYYYGADCKAAQDFLQIDGTWYYFSDGGYMCTDRAVYSEKYNCAYVLSENGKSYVAMPKQGWYKAFGNSYYVGEDGHALYNEILCYEGMWYGFDWNGRMYADKAFWCNDYYYRAKENGVLYCNEWVQPYTDWDDYDWYYYGADAKAPQDFVQIDGTWYYFSDSGYMVTDRAVYSEKYNCAYVLSEDGKSYVAMPKQGWYKAFGNSYYINEYGYPLYNKQQIDGVWYCFNSDGQLCTNGICTYYDHDREEWVYALASANGALVQNGWAQIDGDWYYVDNWNAIDYGVHQINGNWYYFNNYKMQANYVQEDFDGYDLGWIDLVIPADGKIVQSGWAKVDGKWYYLDNYALCQNGAYEINGKYYYFDWYGCLVQKPGPYSYYFITKDGTVLTNAWQEDKIGEEPGYRTGWKYFGSDGRYYETGVYIIDGIARYFDSSGIMQTNTVSQGTNAVYLFDANGVGTKVSGWVQEPSSQKWYYANGTQLVYDETMLINGYRYAFDSNGWMVSNDYFYDYSTKSSYLFGANGKGITTTGWQKVDGAWYYVESGGKLATGWRKLNGKWYNLNPAMLHDCMLYDETENVWYTYDAGGVASKLTGNGWKDVSWGRIYLENGKPVTGWKQLGGYWYYFDYEGVACTGTYCYSNGYRYGFDTEGKMLTNAWLWGNYYFGANGKGVTGLQTIDGKQYYFDEDGYLYNYDNILIDINGATYYIKNGIVQFKVVEGWIQANGRWYYGIKDEWDYYDTDLYLAQGCYDINNNDKWYVFGNDYALLTNGLQQVWSTWYLTDANGVAKTGWNQYNGNWYYNAAHWGGLYEGEHEINGYTYVFDEETAVLKTGTFVYDDCLYVATDGGKVQSKKPLPDGWTYDDTCHSYRYLKNGQPVTGWVGDYYVEDGVMLVNEFVAYNNAWYYVDKDGRYVKNGWYQIPSGSWIFARSNGTLYCNEWLQRGTTWYYFDGYRMATYGAWINDVQHDFDENGKWLGKSSTNISPMPVMADGWQKINNKWYYYHAGKPVIGSKFINGSWYQFGDGYYPYWEEDFDLSLAYMISNCAFEGDYYYGADGKRVNITGWKQIEGRWYYFNTDHTMADGLKKINGVWYYFEELELFDSKGNPLPMNYAPAMAKNTAVVENNKLYIFDANGKCYNPTTKDGWYQVDGQWYYVVNGVPAQSEAVLYKGNYYYFDYNGIMVTNEIVNAYGVLNDIFYVNSSGIIVTTAGWYKVYDRWIYVQNNGTLCYDGIYKINGKTYSFYDYYLVE